MKFIQLKLYNLITAPKVHTNLLWDLSILFSVLALVYFSAIFYYRIKFKKNSADTAKRKKELAPMVSEFLFYQENEGTKEENNSYIEQKIAIRELLKDKRNENVLSEILLDLRKDVSGDTMKSLFKLYKDLNLEIKAFEKLRSFKWQKISQGMFELTQMQVKESYSFISRFINDKRSVVRKQAEISTVTLMDEGISYFLDTTKYQISEWQQLKILEVISGVKGFEPPRFNKWLTSNNRDVVLFSLRLIKHYDQNESEESIISLVRHRDNKIKNEAIDCIKKFNFKSSRSILKAIFKTNNSHIKLAILDALASFENKEDIKFLEKVYRKDFNFTVKSKALSAINTIYPGHVIPSENLDEIPASLKGKIVAKVEEKTTIINTPVIVEPIGNEKQIINDPTEVFANEVDEVITVINDVEKSDLEVSVKSESKDVIEPVGESILKQRDYSVSVFKSLFDVSDHYCQLLLLDEILNVGDQREITYLESLANHQNIEIQDKALVIKVALEAKLNPEIDIEQSVVEIVESLNVQVSDLKESTKVKLPTRIYKETEITETVENLLPLEYCFLLGELGIKAPRTKSIFEINFDFDYSIDNASKFNKGDTLTSNHPTKDDSGLTKEEHNFFQQLLHFPLTIKDDING